MSFGQQEGRIAALHTFMSAQFPGSQLAERHGGRIDYALSSKPGEALRIAEVFGKVEAAKLELSVEEYSSAKRVALKSNWLRRLTRVFALRRVTQSSLEGIFNEFAGQQEEETGAVRGIVSARKRDAAADDAAVEQAGNPLSSANGLTAL